MRKILFVDDEHNVLSGLQRLLRPMRSEWEIALASGGQEALDIMAKQPFDVLVSDMRMPGMDGLTLLNEVMRKYPDVVRIVLSGHASEEMAVRLAGAAHQYLAKPCDPGKLTTTIDRAFALRDLMSNASLQQSLAQMKSIPSMPDLYAELVEELNHPDASIRRVGEIISQDPGMTAKLLQLVNSAFFGIPRHISSPSQAASLLGTDTLRSLVLGIEVFSEFQSIDCEGLSLDSLWEHSNETGRIAREIASAQRAARETIDAAAMAGILHDVGKLIFAHNLPEQYREVLTRAGGDGAPLPNVEHDILGATHAEVGAYLLGLWGLPNPIVEAVAFHHSPSRSFGEEFTPLTALHVANVLAHERSRTNEGSTVEQLDLTYLAKLGLEERVPAWRDSCGAALNAGGSR